MFFISLLHISSSTYFVYSISISEMATAKVHSAQHMSKSSLCDLFQTCLDQPSFLKHSLSLTYVLLHIPGFLYPSMIIFLNLFCKFILLYLAINYWHFSGVGTNPAFILPLIFFQRSSPHPWLQFPTNANDFPTCPPPLFQIFGLFL